MPNAGFPVVDPVVAEAVELEDVGLLDVDTDELAVTDVLVATDEPPELAPPPQPATPATDAKNNVDAATTRV